MENFEDCKQPHAFFAILDPFIPLCVPRSAAQRGNCLNLQFNDHSFRAALVGGTTAAQSVGARSESSSHRKDVIMKEHQFLLHSSINKRDGGGAPAALDWGIRARQLSVRFWECFRAEMTREAFPDKYTETHTLEATRSYCPLKANVEARRRPGGFRFFWSVIQPRPWFWTFFSRLYCITLLQWVGLFYGALMLFRKVSVNYHRGGQAERESHVWWMIWILQHV